MLRPTGSKQHQRRGRRRTWPRPQPLPSSPHTLPHSHTHTQAHTHTCKNTHRFTQTQPLLHICTHTPIMHSQTHTDMLRRAHTHTHTVSGSQALSLPHHQPRVSHTHVSYSRPALRSQGPLDREPLRRAGLSDSFLCPHSRSRDPHGPTARATRSQLAAPLCGRYPHTENSPSKA